MNHIFINARFLTQEITGVQRFALEISKELKKRYKVILISPPHIIHQSIADELEVQCIGHGSGHFWEQVSLPLYLRSIGSPVLLNLTNSAPLFYKRNITTFCDVSVLTNPEWYSKNFTLLYRFLIPKLAKKSLKILTISEFSKLEILKNTEANELNISVIYCALPPTFYNEDIITTKQDYLLCVSSINPRKNFERTIDAFIKLNEPNFKLLIVGENRANFANTDLVSNINENVVFLGRVSDEELKTLYKNAKGFVYASLYEGFGIPPLEAQALGCPVLASNISVHQEVLQDSVLYCNPLSTESMIEGMNELIKADNKYLIEKGRENTLRFSWRKSAQKLMEVIENL